MKNSPFAEAFGGNFDLRPAFDKKYGIFKSDTPAFYFKNIQGLEISRLKINREDNLPEYHTNAIYNNSIAAENTGLFLELKDVSGREVIRNSDLSGAKKDVQGDTGHIFMMNNVE